MLMIALLTLYIWQDTIVLAGEKNCDMVNINFMSVSLVDGGVPSV